MPRKIILTLCLIIGSNSCGLKDVDPDFQLKYYYINHSGCNINIEVSWLSDSYKYYIANNDTLLLETDEIKGKINPIEQRADSVIVKYSNGKSMIYYGNTPNSPIEINNYTRVGNNKFNCDYYYIFE